MMTFAVGEKVVYPNQGVGMIENISTRCFEARPEKFYLLRLFCSSMTVMVPFSNAESIGLRRLSKTADVTKVLAYLAGPAVENLGDWKLRFKINSDKMLTGSLLQISEVFKQLVRPARGKTTVVPRKENAGSHPDHVDLGSFAVTEHQ